MNKKIIYTLIVITFCIFQTAMCKTSWQNVAYIKKNIIDLYFDTASVKQNKNYVYYRVRAKFAGDDFVCWVKSDCQKNLTSVLECRPYSKEVAENFYNYRDSKRMRSFNNTSPMYFFHNKICQEYYADNSKQNENSGYWKKYMLALEANIKTNWKPPKQGESGTTTVLFHVGKDGSLKDLKIIKTSGNIKMDKSVLNAIKKTAPFKPLPKEYKGQSVPIEFDFDYTFTTQE